MKRSIVLVITLAMSFAGWSQYDDEARAILDAVSEKYKQMTFTADFEFSLENKSAGVNDTYQGSIAVSGDKYKAVTKDGIILNDGTDVYTFMAEVQEVNISTYYPEDEEIGFNNIFTIYKEGYKYALMEIQENGNRVLELAPEEPKAFSKIRMIITPNIVIERFLVFNRNGNVWSYVISNLEENAELPANHFELLKNYDENSGQASVRYLNQLMTVEVIDFR